MLHDTKPNDRLRLEIAGLTRAGRSVPLATRDAVAVAVPFVWDMGRGLAELAEAAATGAAEAATEHQDPSGVLRAAIDGIADGFVTAAQALQQCLRESGERESDGRGSAFANDQLERAALGFRALSAAFVDSVTTGVRNSGGHGDDAVKAIRDHAQLVLRRSWPSFAAVASTARRAMRPHEGASGRAFRSLSAALLHQLQRQGIASARTERR
ncbi:MAG: DUF6781 family protein [Planctomycetota bacterium]